MPFTLSHPALVLPLIGRKSLRFSAMGLIIGSVAPDFESFIRFDEQKVYSHTWAGAFWFDLPLGLVITFLFYFLVSEVLIANLPIALGKKLTRSLSDERNKISVDKFPMLCVSLLIGILSHLLWDAFTHFNLVNPGMNTATIHLWNTYLHNILQDVSSLVGFLIVVIYVVRLPASMNDLQTVPVIKKLLFWILFSIIALIIGYIAYIHNTRAWSIEKPVNLILRIYIGMAACIWSLLVVCGIYKLSMPVKKAL